MDPVDSVNIFAGYATLAPPQFVDEHGKLLSWEEVKDIREKNGFPSVECPEMLLPPNMRMPPVLESSQVPPCIITSFKLIKSCFCSASKSQQV